MLKALLNLIYPNICYGCGNSISPSIKNICIACRSNLARLNTSLLKQNPIEKIFWGRTNFQSANTYLKFEKKGTLQSLLHSLKYKGVYQVGTTLGRMAALELKSTGIFEEIDLIVPVPIHKVKEEKRGFNQSHYIADGMAEILDIPVDKTSISKEVNTKSQTRKSRFERFKNVDQTFTIKNAKSLENKHLLLVDDVLTTGATAEACANTLLAIKNTQLSLFTIAFTY